jgi:hypothetical protein
MNIILKIIPVILYFLVGLISLSMALKSLASKGFIQFHEQAAGRPLDKIDAPLRQVILALMRVSGAGFLTVALMLMTFPVVNYFHPDAFTKYAVPAIAMIFCVGLFLANYLLHKETKADTPWQGAIMAIVIISAGILISLIKN